MALLIATKGLVSESLLPRLTTSLRRLNLNSIVETVLLLAASAQGVRTAEAPQDRREGSNGEEGVQSEISPATDGKADSMTDTSITNSSASPLIIITIHPSDLEQVLDAAPTAETRTAWLQGLATESGPPLLLRQPSSSPAFTALSTPFRPTTSQIWSRFDADARAWWSG